MLCFGLMSGRCGIHRLLRRRLSNGTVVGCSFGGWRCMPLVCKCLEFKYLVQQRERKKLLLEQNVIVTFFFKQTQMLEGLQPL